MPPKARIILVEDSPYVSEKTKQILEQNGHVLLFTARDFNTAETEINKLKKAPDIAIIDRTILIAPDYTDTDSDLGGAIAGIVEEKFPETTIIFFSDYEDQEFGNRRFPEAGQPKSLDAIEEGLVPLVNQLPAARR